MKRLQCISSFIIYIFLLSSLEFSINFPLITSNKLHNHRKNSSEMSTTKLQFERILFLLKVFINRTTALIHHPVQHSSLASIVPTDIATKKPSNIISNTARTRLEPGQDQGNSFNKALSRSKIWRPFGFSWDCPSQLLSFFGMGNLGSLLHSTFTTC